MTECEQKVSRLTLSPENNQALNHLCGQMNEHIKLIEKDLQLQIKHRGVQFEISGPDQAVATAMELLQRLYQKGMNKVLTLKDVHMAMQAQNDCPEDEMISIKMNNALISPKGMNQQQYLKSILNHDINFGVGPAGTGKTFLAVVCAIQALEQERVKKILLVRPAVEAGESLGFLPGDFSQKVEPYLRPLYDALFDLMGVEWVNKRFERHEIEVAPLAYMRGRTLNDSFIILDEAQNTTIAQMKMFLTRLGFGSTAVVTGDLTQIDLPGGMYSGLKHTSKVLQGVPGISFTHFEARDAVRHKLVQKIIQAYDAYDRRNDG